MFPSYSSSHILPLCCIAGWVSLMPPLDAAPPECSDTLADHLGFCVHIQHDATKVSNPYHRVIQPTGSVAATLKALKVRHVRTDYMELGNTTAVEQHIKHLHNYCGVRTTLILNHGVYSSGKINPENDEAQMRRIAADPALCAAIEAIEPRNEFNQFAHKTPQWGKCIHAQTQNLAALRQQLGLRDRFLLLAPSMWYSGQRGYPFGRGYDDMHLNHGQLAGLVDKGNLHHYAESYETSPALDWSHRVDKVQAEQVPAVAGHAARSIWCTEFGHHTDQLSPMAQAKFLTRMWCESYRCWRDQSSPVEKLFIYELLDEPEAGRSQTRYGVVTVGPKGSGYSQHTPKPAFNAISYLMTLAEQKSWDGKQWQWNPGRPKTPSQPEFTLDGALPSTHHLVLWRTLNGDYLILLWQEVPSWTAKRGDRIPDDDIVTLRFTQPSQFSSIDYSRMSDDGSYRTAPVRTTRDAAGLSVEVPVPDSVAVLILRPGSAKSSQKP
jgi:hypothetical protein